MRGAVEKYEAKSPLYGMVQYRRRKVILKYVPEGTSRLLQGTSSLLRLASLICSPPCCSIPVRGGKVQPARYRVRLSRSS